MKKLILALAAVSLFTPSLSAQVRVKGYVKKDGTYVAPHYRSSPNRTTSDNWSTRGNTNPYTGEAGTKDPYSTSRPTYGSEQKTECYFNCPN